jgi:hypothetical protein
MLYKEEPEKKLNFTLDWASIFLCSVLKAYGPMNYIEFIRKSPNNPPNPSSESHNNEKKYETIYTNEKYLEIKKNKNNNIHTIPDELKNCRRSLEFILKLNSMQIEEKDVRVLLEVENTASRLP